MRGRFYFNDHAPCYDGLTYFTSRNWHEGDRSPWPEFGETEDAQQRWRNGSFPVDPPPARIVGTADQVQGRQPVPPPEGPYVLGLPLACWADRPIHDYCPDGGDADDGTALVTSGAGYDSTGGDADDGTGAVVYYPGYAGTGGDADDGAAIAGYVYELAGTGGDADDGGAAAVYDPGMSFGGCSSVGPTLMCFVNTMAGHGLDGKSCVMTWGGTQYTGSFTACGGATFNVTLYEVTTTPTATFSGPGGGPPPMTAFSTACNPYLSLHNGFFFYPACGAPALIALSFNQL